mmetsp:Transcript_61403/g.120544  ORF Transcript_61403/g.120544 Transcript_61403/m.120544 type:complete len:100 (+) Transcript_61403:147-446(+)
MALRPTLSECDTTTYTMATTTTTTTTTMATTMTTVIPPSTVYAADTTLGGTQLALTLSESWKENVVPNQAFHMFFAPMEYTTDRSFCCRDSSIDNGLSF